MKELNDENLSSSWHDGVLLVSDYCPSIIAEKMLNTIQLFREWDQTSPKHLNSLVGIKFGLDIGIEGNPLHVILWENWISIMCSFFESDIVVEWSWSYPKFDISEEDIRYLQQVKDGEITY